MDKANIKCVKVEVLETNGEPSKWTEYWSNCFVHPYNIDEKRGEFVSACNGEIGMEITCPSVCVLGHWLNDDIGFLTDRMTCDITDGGDDWKKCRLELASVIEDCTEVKEVIINGTKGRSSRFRLTPLDKIPTPLKAYEKEFKWDMATKKDIGERLFEFTDEAYEMIVKAVEEANR